MPSGNRRPARSWLPGAVILVAVLLVVSAGFLDWMTLTLAGGSPSTLTGWGTIGGAESAVGENINDVITSLEGSGSYRPALLVTALAALVLPAGIRLTIARSRLAAAGAAAGGACVAGWGLFRALVPGDVAGILTDGDTAHAAVGPWLVLVAGVAMVAAAVPVLIAPAPAPPLARTRGIQPRR